MTRKLLWHTLAAVLVLAGISCGINSAFVLNVNQTATQVSLSQNNYRMISTIHGSADVTYVMLMGGMNKKALFNNAYADMMRKADLATGARALVNVITEEHVGGLPPLYFTRTVTVTANVIEFIK
jgi:hypothetical protein